MESNVGLRRVCVQDIGFIWLIRFEIRKGLVKGCQNIGFSTFLGLDK